MTLLLAALLSLQQPDEDVAALLRLLNSKDPVISSRSEETLEELGSRVIPHLERAAKAGSAPERERLERIIKVIREFETGLESWDTDRLQQLLSKLDTRALQLERRLSRKEGKPARVAVVIDRSHATRLGAENAYTLATYSFEFGTRDRAKLVRNDWDFCFDQGRLRVRTVVDDRSDLWSVGADFDKLQIDDKQAKRLDDMPEVGKGQVYVIHTDDMDTNLWTKMQILEQRAGQWILFRWEGIKDTPAMMKLERSPDRLLKSGQVRLQLRTEGGSPARLHLDGLPSMYLRRLSTKPLDMGGGPGLRRDSVGYVEGGLIPMGKVWVLRRAKISAGCQNNGSFTLTVKGQVLASVAPLAKEPNVEKTWEGRLVVRPGEERSVFAEISDTSQCDVVLMGALWDEKYADVEVFPELEGDDKKKAERLEKDLASDDIVTRERAVHDLLDWGPPVLGHLQRVDGSKKSPEFRAMLKEIILKLGGE